MGIPLDAMDQILSANSAMSLKGSQRRDAPELKLLPAVEETGAILHQNARIA